MASGQYKNKAYPLRINESTLDTIKAIAETNRISANKQIELILEDYIETYNTQTVIPLHERVKDMKPNKEAMIALNNAVQAVEKAAAKGLYKPKKKVPHVAIKKESSVYNN